MSNKHQTPEQQAASNVFEALTAQQQRELMSYAESLLVDSEEWNSKIRQETLKQMSADKTSGKDVDKLTGSLMPMAMASMPDEIRQAVIVKLRQMLLAPQ